MLTDRCLSDFSWDEVRLKKGKKQTVSSLTSWLMDECPSLSQALQWTFQ